MGNPKPLPPLEELREKFDYDPETGIFTWLKPSKYKPFLKGQVAGSINAGGYRVLNFRSQNPYYCHRIAWYLFTGDDPGVYFIDHKDRDRDNNKISNLRLCTTLENAGNNGGEGVYWDKSRDKWAARIKHNNKAYFLGRFSDYEQAKETYAVKAVELRGEFAPQECLRRASQ